MNREFDKAVHDTMALLDAISAGYDARVPASLVKLATKARTALLEGYDLQKAEERRGGWIPVGERMPEQREMVAFLARRRKYIYLPEGGPVPSGEYDGCDVEVGSYNHDVKTWGVAYDMYEGDHWQADEVTHWQPLPGVPG